MRVISLTAERLELRHRTMAYMLIVGVACLAGGVITLLRGHDWKVYVGASILFAIGVVMVPLATNSRVVFDMRRHVFEAEQRGIWGTTKIERGLSDISGVVLDRDAMFGNVLVVIAVRVHRRDLPITRFGTPFPAAAFHDGLLISRFLRCPLMKRDRIVLETPDSELEDMLSDAIFERGPQAFRRLRTRRK